MRCTATVNNRRCKCNCVHGLDFCYQHDKLKCKECKECLRTRCKHVYCKECKSYSCTHCQRKFTLMNDVRGLHRNEWLQPWNWTPIMRKRFHSVFTTGVIPEPAVVYMQYYY